MRYRAAPEATMTSLRIRQLPDDVYSVLAEHARRAGRGPAQQAL